MVKESLGVGFSMRAEGVRQTWRYYEWKKSGFQGALNAYSNGDALQYRAVGIEVISSRGRARGVPFAMDTAYPNGQERLRLSSRHRMVSI